MTIFLLPRKMAMTHQNMPVLPILLLDNDCLLLPGKMAMTHHIMPVLPIVLLDNDCYLITWEDGYNTPNYASVTHSVV
jgi:hypothetical protein